MRLSAACKLIILSLQLLLLCGTGLDGKLSTLTLEKRMNDRTDAHEGRQPETLFFDALHNGYFNHLPNPTAPSASDAEEMYPETYFFEGHPVFFTGFSNPLKRNELHQAYNLFGKVHLVDTDTERFLTIRPESHRPGQPVGFHRYDVDLKPFFHRARTAERTYGQAVAKLLLGPEMLRVSTYPRDARPSNADQMQSRTTTAVDPLVNGPPRTAEELRQRLRQDGSLKVSSLDRRLSLDLRFDTDGTLQKLSQGDVDHDIADVLRNSIGTLI